MIVDGELSAYNPYRIIVTAQAALLLKGALARRVVKG
jgi:hypothetical protein